MRSYPVYITNSFLTRVYYLSYHTSFELVMKALVVNAWPKLNITLQYSSFGFTFAASVSGLWKNKNNTQATNNSD